jgi:hypothetical protein
VCLRNYQELTRRDLTILRTFSRESGAGRSGCQGRMILQVLVCGSELNVGAFAHPTLNAETIEVHVPVRAAFAKLLGRVMPFWMSSSTLLNLSVLLPFERLTERAWNFAAIAAGIQVFAVLFSLVFLVPIDNRIMRWAPATVPQDWRAQERDPGTHATRPQLVVDNCSQPTLY